MSSAAGEHGMKLVLGRRWGHHFHIPRVDSVEIHHRRLDKHHFDAFDAEANEPEPAEKPPCEDASARERLDEASDSSTSTNVISEEDQPAPIAGTDTKEVPAAGSSAVSPPQPASTDLAAGTVTMQLQGLKRKHAHFATPPAVTTLGSGA